MSHIRKLLHFVKPYWRRSLVSLIFLVAVTFMDLTLPRLIQRIIDQGINGNDMRIVITTTILMLVISILQTLFALANNLFSIQVGESVARDLREALFLKIQSFSFGNLDHLNTGQLMVRLSSDTTAFQRMVQVSLRIGTRAPLLMIGSLILMFVTDSKLALMVLPVLVATTGIILFFVSRMGPLFMTVQKKLDRLNMVLQENIAGVRLVKAFVRANHEGQRFATANEDFAERNISVMRFMATLSPAMSIFVNIGMWFERFVIIATTLARDYLPSSWSYYVPTWVEVCIFMGTIGLFFTLYLIFTRVAPVVAVAEVKAILKTSGDQYSGAHAHEHAHEAKVERAH